KVIATDPQLRLPTTTGALLWRAPWAPLGVLSRCCSDVFTRYPDTTRPSDRELLLRLGAHPNRHRQMQVAIPRVHDLGTTAAAVLSTAGLLQRLVQLALALLLEQVVQRFPLGVRLVLEDAAIHLESA